MIKLGITGNIATGKSTVENLLQQEGYPVIDADKIVHDLYKEPAFIEKISDIFKGEDVFENNSLSRKKIGSLVFKDKDKLKSLENILHPEVKKKIKEYFKQNEDKPVAVASIPLLFEAKMEDLFDFIITVFVDEKTQIERLIARNGYSLEEAKQRISCQIPQEEKKKLANFVIDNSGSIENTKKQLNQILNHILKT